MLYTIVFFNVFNAKKAAVILELVKQRQNPSRSGLALRFR